MLHELAAERIERQRLKQMFEQAPGFMALIEGPDSRIALANKAFEILVGREEPIGKILDAVMPKNGGLHDIVQEAQRSGEAFVGRAFPLRTSRSDGQSEEVLVDLVAQPLVDRVGVFVQGHNVTDDNRNEILRNAHNRVLELAIGDSPLEQTLGELIGIVEATSKTGVLGSILLLDPDGKHLRHGAAPSLPAAYCAAIDGAETGPCAGSCGTAAYLGTPVFVSDIATDPLWADFRAVALPHGLRACWSTPILTRGRRVLGTFAMYHREPREPTVRDLMLVDLVTQTAALVIDRESAHAALQKIAAIAQKTTAPVGS